MTTLEKATELAYAIKADPILVEYQAARAAYDASVDLQTKMTEYNAQRAILGQEFSKEVEEQSPELLDMVRNRMDELAREIAAMEEYKNFSAAQLKVTDLMNEINAEILCGLLEIYGAETVVRTNGAKAVREFRERAPGTYDAVLMDIQMPEAARAIRGLDRPDARTVPIIAMTANAFSEDVQAALAAGMTAHVAKPIDTAILQSTLRRALEDAGGGPPRA